MHDSSLIFLMADFKSIKNKYTNFANINCRERQGIILGPLLFLLYINDIFQAVDWDLILYVGSCSLIFRPRDVKIIAQMSTNYFWMSSFGLPITNLKVYCLTEKTRLTKDSNLDTKYDTIPHSYLGWALDENLSVANQ